MALKDKKPNGNLKIDEALAAAIRARLRDGRLPCAAAFLIAEELGVSLREVGRAADALGIRLSHCQLGAF
jgi:DNA invertase Pin-like site-specific DNA recombinase